MSAKAIFLETVKLALIKDGWTITSDLLTIRSDRIKLEIDLGAEKVFAAEKDGKKIAVEVKRINLCGNAMPLQFSQQTQRNMVTLPLNPLKIPSYLNLANAIKNLPKKNTWTFYDPEADVLYINFHQPALAADDSELTDDDILIRYQNDEIIGLTILNVNNRL